MWQISNLSLLRRRNVERRRRERHFQPRNCKIVRQFKVVTWSTTWLQTIVRFPRNPPALVGRVRQTGDHFKPGISTAARDVGQSIPRGITPQVAFAAVAVPQRVAHSGGRNPFVWVSSRRVHRSFSQIVRRCILGTGMHKAGGKPFL